MSPAVNFALVGALSIAAFGGVYFAFAGNMGGRAEKRIAALGKPSGSGKSARSTAESADKRRKNVQNLLKDIEKQQKQNKQRPSLRKRLDRAGLSWTPQTFWIVSAVLAAIAVAICSLSHQAWYVTAFAAFGVGLGLPRWIISFLTKRRAKKFTREFANAIDVIVRSVRSGLPTNEALKIVAKEIPDPVGNEFNKLVEGLKVGVTLEQGLKRMFDNMPTPEVSFFAIVMTIQQKSGGNLSEALSNLAGVLRDRKRLEGKIKAMSSEAKASAMIIGSLPPTVTVLVYLTTPKYIMLLFTERLGNLMLVGIAIWMSLGIAVMRKMINFKH
jgi:tight adherence protein B